VSAKYVRNGSEKCISAFVGVVTEALCEDGVPSSRAELLSISHLVAAKISSVQQDTASERNVGVIQHRINITAPHKTRA
jgi:hypothetical protein